MSTRNRSPTADWPAALTPLHPPQGLQLKRKEAASALTAPREIAYGLASILLITPLLGLLVVQLPLYPRPLAFGLGVVCAVPTALACGVAFVQVGSGFCWPAGSLGGWWSSI